jgi:molybdate transport system regulatory protein
MPCELRLVDRSIRLHCSDERQTIPAMDDTPPSDPSPTRLSLRLVFGADAMMGPGKAELLERIRDTGSISAAGRAMKMSYKRAWMLVVESTRGGPNGGGAKLTEAGQTVVAQYRSLVATVVESGAPQISTLRGMLRDIPGQK